MSGFYSSALSEEQIALRDMALRFARERIAPYSLAWDAEKNFPVETLREAAGLGMAAIYAPEALGGSGLGRVDGALIFEALAMGCPTIAAYLSIHNMCCSMVAIHGDQTQRDYWLPRLISMRSLASYCLTEPNSGSDAAALHTRAKVDGDFYVIDGQKQFISGAGASGEAHLYVVMARTGSSGPAGISAFLVGGDAPGLSLGKLERKMGWNAQPTRAVILDRCRVPAGNLLGRQGDGFRMAMAALDGGRLNIAACSIGGAQSALDKAMHYMREREAFGSRLDSFQALQFRIADMATELEAARALLWRAAAALDARAQGATELCAMAKRVATDAGFSVANTALQMLGGYGYLAEYGVEKIVRDLRVHQILEGTNEIMRLIVARGLLREGASS